MTGATIAALMGAFCAAARLDTRKTALLFLLYSTEYGAVLELHTYLPLDGEGVRCCSQHEISEGALRR